MNKQTIYKTLEIFTINQNYLLKGAMGENRTRV